MGTCRYCGDASRTISGVIGFCADCIRADFDKVWPEIKKVQAVARDAGLNRVHIGNIHLLGDGY